MSDLLSWLRATIEGDKAVAVGAASSPRAVEYLFPDGPDASGRAWEERQVPDGGAWFVERDLVMSWPQGMHARRGVVGGSCGCCYGDSEGRSVDLDHIQRHDPRDTIARCEAELKILDIHKPVDGYGRVEYRELKDPGKVCEVCCFDWDGPLIGKFPCDTLIALAAGRRHRPGFNPEWVSE
ncbi:hypothetical protein DMB42_11655 [Nonomuraea sp. WAC 01424]|uniref:DUF6221 family protein n=1 Tax=Nonomuraea sp. WAC 01424 TaxID=2203200 RepID=UPI000F7A3AE1|nr:DUF6221 family protein [Nonomuraea sp. WAC 01424]RSN12826.1 hypothetical protein DMB42_11655 [Nonomuraea sp. WAC 01424]